MRWFVFGLAGFLAAALAPLMFRLAIRIGAQDTPMSRKVHVRSMPRLGGIAILAATAAAMGLALFVGGEAAERILSVPSPIVGLAIAGLVVALVGILDDVLDISPWVKLGGQVVAAAVVWHFGFRLQVFDLGFAQISLGALGLPLTLFWIVAVMNALNMIDGLDGLAASQALIALCVLLVQALVSAGPVAGLLASALAGAIAGFLLHNMHPARQFMGTSGSLLLGLILACLAIGTLRGKVGFQPVVPLLALGVPFVDMAFAIARRLYRGSNPMRGDRGHLHHRLLNEGMGHNRAVWTLAIYQAAFGTLGIVSLFTPSQWQWAFAIPAALITVLLLRRVGVFQPESARRAVAGKAGAVRPQGAGRGRA